MPDFRDQRRQRQEQPQPQQGIAPVTPEDVYSLPVTNRETALQLNSETVKTKGKEKVSFYPRQDQIDKLDDLASDYNKLYRRQRKRIDRQDIVRHLIDTCTLDTLSDLQ